MDSKESGFKQPCYPNEGFCDWPFVCYQEESGESLFC